MSTISVEALTELLSVARRAIEDPNWTPRARETGEPFQPVSSMPSPDDGNQLAGYFDVNAPGASFVTLTKNGRLRGCIGSLEAHRPLIDDVAGNARAAAFSDPRFPPVRHEELAGLTVEVSVLSQPQPLHVTTREELEGALQQGVDGVILKMGQHRATFLPQVWDQLPDPVDFIDHLLLKAGLSASFWSDQIQIETYKVTAVSEAPDG